MQDFLALTIVALAVAYLGRLGWQRIASKRTGGCGSCGNCASEQELLVQIQPQEDYRAEAQRAR